MRKSTLIGALSLVIVVWLGTSMNCSRMSTLTGRSTSGIRNRSPGSRTIASLVLPSRNTTIRSYCCTTRTDRYRTMRMTTATKARAASAAAISMSSPVSGAGVRRRRRRPKAWFGQWLGRLDDRGQAIEADELDAGVAREPLFVSRSRRPCLATELHGSGGLERRLDDPRRAGRQRSTDRPRRRPDPAAQEHAASRECHQGEDGEEFHER